MGRPRLLVVAGAGALVASALALALVLVLGSGGAAPGGEERASSFAGAELPGPAPAPDFTLRDASGRTVPLSGERGKIVFLTFLYTSCPDVCPLIAARLNETLRRLGPERESVRVVAVSVDPEGDTPGRVAAYGETHRLLPQFSYLIGDRAALEPVWRAYHVLSVARDPDLVDHSAFILLLDRRGRERVLYPTDAAVPDLVHDARILLGG